MQTFKIKIKTEIEQPWLLIEESVKEFNTNILSTLEKQEIKQTKITSYLIHNTKFDLIVPTFEENKKRSLFSFKNEEEVVEDVFLISIEINVLINDSVMIKDTLFEKWVKENNIIKENYELLEIKE